MGANIRAFDWSQTSLGPPDGWPQSLRSTISILLPSKAQIALFWGPDLVTFYNDAYCPSLGTKHPDALGLPLRELWPELWDTGLKQLMDGVITTGEAHSGNDLPFYLERFGFAEETFFDFSYDPVRDETGQVAGVFCIVAETTARVVGERRLRTLRALSSRMMAETNTVDDACQVAARVFADNPLDLPFVLVYLIDADTGTARLAGSTGLPDASAAAPQHIDLTAPDVTPGGWPLRAALQTRGAEVVADLAQRFGPLPGGPWPEPAQTAVVLPITTSDHARLAGFVIAGISPRRPLDDGYRGFLDLLGSQIADAVGSARAVDEERKHIAQRAEFDRNAAEQQRQLRDVAEAARRQTTAILESMTDGFIAMDAGGRWTAMNAAAEHLLDRPRAAVLGTTDTGILPEILGTDVEGTDIGPHLRRAQADRAAVEFESLDPSGRRWLSNRIYPTPDGGIAVFFQDITPRKRAELDLAFLASISQRLTHSSNEAEMMRTVGANIGAHFRLSHCAFAEINEAADQVVIGHDWHQAAVPSLVGVHRLSEMLTAEFQQATAAGEIFVVDDTQTDPRTDAAQYAVLQVGAFLSVPLVRHGESRFLLAVACATPHTWHDDEIELMREVAERIWTRLERLRAETEVRESEQRYRSLFNSMDEGFCIAEVLFDEAGHPVDHRILEANPAFERQTGVTDPVGKTASELVPGMEPFWNEMFGRVATTGQSVRFQHGSDAMERWFDVFASRVGDATSRKVAILFSDVSERRQAELALQHRTEQFETLLNEAPLGVYLVDADFRVRAVNPAAAPTFASIPDVIGRDFDEVMQTLWPQARANTFVKHFRHTLRTGEPYIAADFSDVRYDSGVAEYYAWRIYRIALPEGGFGVVCYYRDISEQVLARAATAESEARYRTLFAAAPMAVFACDRDAVIQQYNRLAAELWGREPLRGVERPCGWMKAGRPDSTGLPHPQSPMVEVLRTGIPAHNVEMSIERPDGSRLPVLANFAALKNASGEITGAVASFMDISERLRTEEALRASEQRLQFVMDSMPQKVFTAHPDGEIHYLNPQWTQFTGLSPGQVRDWGRSGFIHPDDLAETLRLWQQGFDTGEPLQIEHRFQRADGEYRWHISRALPLRDRTGRIEMWVGSSTETHEQQQAAEELRQLAGALSEADRRKDEFLAMLAHELRNPLAPLRNALQILQLTDGNAGAVKLASEIMERQTGQMIRLVDELLDVSRISRGTIDLRREPVELATVIHQAVETSRPAIERARHELVVTLPPQPVRLHADAVRLVQVFGNLLDNAGKYTEPGGRITLTAERRGPDVVVTVKDTGIGIPADQLPSVFEMFSQAHGSLERSRGGLGIGLTLVQRLVELHGGSVSAASEGPDQGSEFTVRLPALAEAVPPAPEPTTLDEATPAPARRRVLVVDDNQDSATSLALYLELVGNETRTAYDGAEAVETAEAFRPDLVLLDIGMPKLNGYEAARKIREQPWGKAMALVALSGWGQEEDRRKSREAGFNDHMVKPVDHAALAKLLAGLPTAS